MKLLLLVVILSALAVVGSKGADEKPIPVKDRTLGMPVANLKLSDIQDTFSQTRDGHRHEATDVMAPRGTPVLAVEDGTIRKLFLSKPGGITIYEFDISEQYCYYYAHLDHYAANLREGMHVVRGETIAYVGSTGDAAVNSPHLHFGITAIGPDKKWWGGTPINPYPILRASYLRRP
jgi:murein DD-endopeptidase MepM/ murein hydrolase activator NlpD